MMIWLKKHGFKIEYANCALNHLKTGYYSLYHQREQLGKEENNIRTIKQQILDKMYNYVHPEKYDIDAEELFKNMKNNLSSFVSADKLNALEKHLLNRLKLVFHISVKDSENLSREVINFLNKSDISQQIHDLTELEDQTSIIENDYKFGLKQIVREQENGTPILGYCDLCPKISINTDI